MRQVIEERTRPLTEVAKLLAKVARGLTAAHELGVVHRDLKPENILLTRDGEPKVADFGTAHLTETDSKLTRTGTLLGTPPYMAPEQLLGAAGAVTSAADLYALGAILYESMTGRPPVEGANLAEVCARLARETPRRPRSFDRRIPPALEAVCLKAIEREPHRRYDSAASLAEDLENFAAGLPVSARLPGLATRLARWSRRHRTSLAVGALLLASAGVALVAWREARIQAYRRLDHEGRESLAVGTPEAVERALGCFRAAADMSPAAPESRLMIGRCLLAKGDAEGAAECWRQILNRQPEHAEALFERGKQSLWSVARLRVPAASGFLGGEDRTGPAEPETAPERDERLAAEADLVAAKNLDPVRGDFVLGALALGRGDFAAAASRLEKYAIHNGWDGGASALAGLAYYYAGDPGKAEERLARALEVQRRPAWRRALAQARVLQGRAGEEDFRALGIAPVVAEGVPLDGLVAWIRADRGLVVKGEEVKGFFDQSGSGGQVTPPSARAAPAYDAAASAIRFDGTDDELRIDSEVAVQRAQFQEGLTLVLVLRAAASRPPGVLLELARRIPGEPGLLLPQGNEPTTVRYSSCSGWLGGLGREFALVGRVLDAGKAAAPAVEVAGAIEPGRRQILGLVHDVAGDVTVFRDGAEAGRGRAPLPEHHVRPEGRFGRGVTDLRAFSGDLFEVLLYNRALNPAERIGLEKNLRARYFQESVEPPDPSWGLKGEYFGDVELKRPMLVRQDPTVEFDWGNGPPAPDLPREFFSVRWTGRIQPLYSEPYTFYALCDDGVRLWIDGKLVIDNWTPHERAENRGTIVLKAGTKYDIRMEMFDQRVYAVARLAWQSPRQSKQVVPAHALFPAQP